MRIGKWTIIAAGVSLVAAACATDSTTTTTTPTTAATSATPIDIDSYQQNDWACNYLVGSEDDAFNELVAVSQTPGFSVADAAAQLTAGGIPADEVELSLVVNGTTAEEAPDDEAIGALSSQIGTLTTDENAIAVAGFLNEQGFEASPIHIMATAAHWRWAPGTVPTAVPGYQVPDPSGDQSEVIAVVDSGIVVDGLPPGLVGVLMKDSFDEETIGNGENEASHGTFVAGLMHQIAPNYTISLVRPRLVDPDSVQNHGNEDVPDVQVTSEIHVAEAIERLLRRHAEEEVGVLNLSFGMYTCNPGAQDLWTGVIESLKKWFEQYEDAHIFAAGGNEQIDIPFWPAALAEWPWDLGDAMTPNEAIHGVGAINLGETEIVWNDSQNPPEQVDFSGIRPWVTHRAPGSDLVNLRGAASASGATAVCWSGSSFATAVASAMHAAGNGAPDHTYASVAGLTNFEFVNDQGQVAETGQEATPVDLEVCGLDPES